jgi:hypothetical protein
MTTLDPVASDSVVSGDWLVESYRGLEQQEATWLEQLGAFDAGEGWRADGQGSCPDWLMTFLDLSRATAFEKVRVARMLPRRPVLAESYHQGRVSYSKVRAITRLETIDTEMEQVLTDLAEEAGLREVEHAVRAYQLHHEQDLPPRFRMYRRGCRIRPVGDGLCQITAIVTELEAAEMERLLDGVIDQDRTPPAGADPGSVGRPLAEEGEAGDESPAGDWWDAWVVSSQEYAERRVEALMDLLGRARDHLYSSPGRRQVADRHLVHVIVGADGQATLPDGTPLSDAEAATVICNAPLVTHAFGKDGNPLYQGRKHREWTTAQRRAALVRDGHCRFPGCWRRRADLHHQWYWATGGPTDIDNGFLACRFHHQLIHEQGYSVTGNPGQILTFTRPDGRIVGQTHPIRR